MKTHTTPLLPRHRLSVTSLQAQDLRKPAQPQQQMQQEPQVPSYFAKYNAWKDALWKIN